MTKNHKHKYDHNKIVGGRYYVKECVCGKPKGREKKEKPKGVYGCFQRLRFGHTCYVGVIPNYGKLL